MAKSNKQKTVKKEKAKLLPIISLAIILLAVALVAFIPKGKLNNTVSKEVNGETQNVDTNDTIKDNNAARLAAKLNDNGDVVINEAEISEEVSFLEYKTTSGVTVGLLAVRASDGTVRTALDTCQVCNGSPYAFFTQKDNAVQCQNCGNIFSLDMIGQERGGCNPIPIMPDERTFTDTEILIPSDLIEENSASFENWKKF